jgi:hypothetical protein
VASEVDDTWMIKITSGDFAGVVYRYNRVGFVEEPSGLRIRFEYDVIDSGSIAEEELTSPQFKATISSILESFLEESQDGKH